MGVTEYILVQIQRNKARLAQSVERETLNLKAAGSTPALGLFFRFCCFNESYLLSIANVLTLLSENISELSFFVSGFFFGLYSSYSPTPLILPTLSFKSSFETIYASPFL